MKKKNLTQKTKITNKDGIETISIDTKKKLTNMTNSLQLVRLKCDIITNKFLCHKEQEVVEAVLEMAEEFKKDKKEDIKSDNSFEALGELVEEYIKDKFFSAEILESIVFIFQTCSAIAIVDSFNNEALKQVYDDEQNFTIALGITVLAEGIYDGAKRILTGDDEEEEPEEEDLTGQKFGNLTVLRKATDEEVAEAEAEAEADGTLGQCDCESCGQEREEDDDEDEDNQDDDDEIEIDMKKEDLSRLPEKEKKIRRLKTYNAWEDMLARCGDPQHPEYKNEGAKGITVCDRWNPKKGGSFENFVEDMGYCPD